MSPEDLQGIFLKEVKKLNLRNPVAEISIKLDYRKPIVSEYLSSKKNVSLKFFKAFCTAYGLDYDTLTISDNIVSEDLTSKYNIDTQKIVNSASIDKGEDNKERILNDNLSIQPNKPMTDRLLDMLQQALDNNSKLSNSHVELIHTNAQIVKLLESQMGDRDNLKRQAS